MTYIEEFGLETECTIQQYSNVLKKHSEQLRLISDILIDKLYVNSPLYAKDILITVQKAKDEFNKEKRLIMARISLSTARQSIT